MCGAGDTFEAAFRAVEQGWSYPPLVTVLEGGIADENYFEELFDDPPLTLARLNVLERQGRYEEYLRLSAAAGEDTSHATMLARLDRAGEAVEYALKYVRAPEQVLAVAEAVRERGHTEEALRVGAWGSRWKVRCSGWRAGSGTWRKVSDATSSPWRRLWPPSTLSLALAPTGGCR